MSKLPYYWGTCCRMAEMNDFVWESYLPGNIINWTQISSAKEGSEPPKHYSERNTKFIIYSATGRNIAFFSNFPNE